MRKLAVIVFVVYSVFLAVLLLTGILSGSTSGLLFAIGLVVFGIVSRGFRS